MTPFKRQAHASYVNTFHTHLRRLRQEVGDRVRSWKEPELHLLGLRNRNDFFLATSSLQKAIRRNLETKAMSYASYTYSPKITGIPFAR
jgi:hypothetical protein